MLKDTVLLAVCRWISANLLKCWNAYIIRVTAVTIVKGVFQTMKEGLTPINRKYFVKIIRNIYICINTGTQPREYLSKSVKIKDSVLEQMLWIGSQGQRVTKTSWPWDDNSLNPQMDPVVSRDSLSVTVAKSCKFQEFEIIWSFGSLLLQSHSSLFPVNLLISVVVAQFNSLFDFFF